MFNKLAAAVIAASLIAGPALAQGTATAPASQPAVKADVIKSTSEVSVVHVKKTYRHMAKVKHVRHFVHAKHVKAVKHVKRTAEIKTVG